MLTFQDDAQLNLCCCSLHIWWVPDFAEEGAIVAELGRVQLNGHIPLVNVANELHSFLELFQPQESISIGEVIYLERKGKGLTHFWKCFMLQGIIFPSFKNTCISAVQCQKNGNERGKISLRHHKTMIPFSRFTCPAVDLAFYWCPFIIGNLYTFCDVLAEAINPVIDDFCFNYISTFPAT